MPHGSDSTHHHWLDALGSFGCGAVYLLLQEWFQLLWSFHCIQSWSRLHESDIALKELLLIVLACAIWGRVWWQCSHVIVHCDNEAVVSIVNFGITHHASSTMSVFFFIWACFQFSLRAVYVPGTANRWADDISCNNLASFFLQVPATAGHQKAVPQPLVELLVI